MATTSSKTRRDTPAGSPASDTAAPEAAVKTIAARASAGAAAKKAPVAKVPAKKAPAKKAVAQEAAAKKLAAKAAAVPASDTPAAAAEASAALPATEKPKARKTAAASSALDKAKPAPTPRGKAAAAALSAASPAAEAAPADTAAAPVAKTPASKPADSKSADSKSADSKPAAGKKAAAKKAAAETVAGQQAPAKKPAARKAVAKAPMRTAMATERSEAVAEAPSAPSAPSAPLATVAAQVDNPRVEPVLRPDIEPAPPAAEAPTPQAPMAPALATATDDGALSADADADADAERDAATAMAAEAPAIEAPATEVPATDAPAVEAAGTADSADDPGSPTEAAGPAAPTDPAGRRRDRGGRGHRGGRRDERGERPKRSDRGEQGGHPDRGPRPDPATAAHPGDGRATAEAADATQPLAGSEEADPRADGMADRLGQGELSPAPAPRPAPVPAPPPPPPPRPVVRAPTSGPQHSRITLSDGDERRIVWQPGQACPQPLLDAGHARADEAGHLRPDDDGALPLLLRLAAEGGHHLQVQPEVWPLLAANRDARTRLHVLELAYPDGPSSPALAGLLAQPLPLYQAEGALFAVVAGRALIADERGLGKGVQAIAALQLWRRHFGLQRVALLCAPAQRAAWQRALRRFAGLDAQVMDGGLHHRQALWSSAADLRILSPEALASDAAHLAQWSPELVIVDEPQHLDGWTTLAAPQALVLCGAPLDAEPALLEAIVDWLDTERQGPLAALRQVQQARQQGRGLDEAQIEQITDTLSRLMLQRQRSEVADQLPALVFSERLVPLGPAQREAHDRALAAVRQGLQGWQRSGYLSDASQWRLGQAVRAAQQACHRADPAHGDSPLAEATVRALAAQLDDWAATGQPNVALRCASESDRAQLQHQLQDQRPDQRPPYPRLALLGPDEALPPDTDVVLQVGAPWRTPRPDDGQARGQQWLSLVGQHSLDCALADTLAQRGDAPRSLADGGRGYLTSGRLAAWLQALQQALAALDAATAEAGSAG